jgi:hypothetical protein
LRIAAFLFSVAGKVKTVGVMNKRGRRKRVIEDKKERGEWVESIFLVRCNERRLPVSKPWGDSRSFDFVVGAPGWFSGVQVKCTIFELENGEGYISVCSCHKPYPPGSFDFIACYVVYEDVWYIIPEKEIWGLKSISLCTEANEGKYEEYREAWSLLEKGPVRDEDDETIEIQGCADEVVMLPAREHSLPGMLWIMTKLAWVGVRRQLMA